MPRRRNDLVVQNDECGVHLRIVDVLARREGAELVVERVRSDPCHGANIQQVYYDQPPPIAPASIRPVVAEVEEAWVTGSSLLQKGCHPSDDRLKGDGVGQVSANDGGGLPSRAPDLSQLTE
ncbi:MAG: hypothetical protein IPH38_16545 [Candidatus Microthrix sp.]|nr:hypothetical protein [Candidatus Microthrix sp.]MBK7021145.1 hypothetical protein [Candidatus Microthrix sp.]